MEKDSSICVCVCVSDSLKQNDGYDGSVLNPAPAAGPIKAFRKSY
jgi:hypothetical protein